MIAIQQRSDGEEFRGRLLIKTQLIYPTALSVIMVL